MTLTSDAKGVGRTGREANRENRRRHILDAGATLFEAKGFEGATTDDIAAAAQVTKRTLYRYFGSKEELLYEIHEDFMSDLLLEVAELSGTPRQRLVSMIEVHLADLASHLRYIKVFFEEIKHLSDTKRTELMSRRRAYEALVRETLAAGITTSDFRPLDVPSTAREILGAMNEGYKWYRSDGSHSSEAIARQVSHLFLHGLIAPSQRTKFSSAVTTATDHCSTSETKESPDPLARIIDSACALFSERGYHRTSTQEIADRAGVTKGALFYHARYKDEALLQIHRIYFGNLQASIAAVPSEGHEPAVVLADLILTYVSVNARERDAVAVVSEERKYLPEHAHKEISAMDDIVHSSIEGIVREGMRLGAFATEDAYVTTMIVVGMINSVHRWFNPKTGLDTDALGRQIASLILYGIT